MSKEFAAYSAVALVEAPDSFIVQQRPQLVEGSLAYPGQYQFLGGRRDIVNGSLEPASDAIVREIFEETTLGRLPSNRFEELWEGPFEGRGKYGEPKLRHVTCFHLGLSAVQAAYMELQASEGGELVYIPKDPEVIDNLVDQLTPFAHGMLAAFVRNRRPEFNEKE